MHDTTFRLLTFNTYDQKKSSDDNDDYNNKEEKEFIVQMFGINEKGKTASIFVEGYAPFFYAKVGDDWTETQNTGFITQLRRDIGKYYENDIISTKLIKRKKLYGFDGGKQHAFVLIKFKNETAMKKAKNLWYQTANSTNGADGEYKRFLKSPGYMCEGYATILYEAQVPPLLRLFHIKEISPSGWISLPQLKTLKHKNHTTSCTYEFTINYTNIIPLLKKETVVPYKICSFDIEASSSHGDFPLANKDYKKLAINIVDLWSEGPGTADYIKSIILAAFGLQEVDVFDGNVDRVYPTVSNVTKELVDTLFARWIKICPATYKGKIQVSNNVNDYMQDSDDGEDGGDEDDDADGGEGGGGEGGDEENKFNWRHIKNKIQPYKKKGTILDLLSDKDKDITRDTRILELTKTLTNIFPKLQGDNVTFIGSTFLRYGDEKPYLNHCIARDTCNQIDNAVIESYKTEKEVLLAWTELIQKEDPDVIIGYNIFGFDYNFMFNRAKELGCERSFLQLSRNKREVCINRNWRTGEETIEESKVVIASGQHDLKFVKMNGRLQIDLYNYLRRDYQLSQYKLDYVSGYFIGDSVKKIEHCHGAAGASASAASAAGASAASAGDEAYTKIYSKNLTGLENGNFINFEEEAHSVDAYKNGKKFEVSGVDTAKGTFTIKGTEQPDMSKKVRWGLAKDDVTPQDIFRMTNEGPAERAIIAKYCIQDCNLVHHLMRKIDVMTGYIEMANLCSVPLDFLVMRGQSIKLTSYIAKKCREKGVLMPVLDKGDMDEGYEGAAVLDPKCNLYLNEPVACLDYGSLYPSSMISENISHDSKVLTREYDLNGRLLAETGDKDAQGKFIYDNLAGYTYVDIEYNTYKWQRKNGNPKAGMEKIKVGYKQCRYAQYPDNGKAIMPAILQELLAARKSTRKLIELHSDEFMKNILDKRQLSIKVTANSLYGQTGAKTSSFYEKDCAASTTAIGRKMLTYAKRVIEEAYENQVVPTTTYGPVKTNAEYVYGDTDSVFFKFNLKDLNDEPIIGQKALEITIELAQQAGELATKFLKSPHDLEYEKTFLPFLLLSKKRYVGMLYETDPQKCKRKSMGIVLKRRDNAPIVKDIYGGIIDILMKEHNIEKAIEFLKVCLQNMVDEKYGMDKLVITKSLRSGYKKPNQIAHKVLADRIGKRDSGNKPSIGDRIPYVFIENPNKKALQGECIETPEYILANKIKIDYSVYITKQIMKPIQQVFALVLEQMKEFKKKKGITLRSWYTELQTLHKEYPDPEQAKKKEIALRNKQVKILLFDAYLHRTDNMKKGYQSINTFFKN
jgi:DNA polymerase elongation subunit (family B)